MGVPRRVSRVLKSAGVLEDRGDWIEPGRVLGCAYPRSNATLAALQRQGVTLLVNLHERPHHAERLTRHELREVHVPVRDFAAPTPEQIERAVAAIAEAVGDGEVVAVHCGGGLGRTGTLLACYLVSRGLAADAAIARVRAVRPGSVETAAQAAAVQAWAARSATA